MTYLSKVAADALAAQEAADAAAAAAQTAQAKAAATAAAKAAEEAALAALVDGARATLARVLSAPPGVEAVDVDSLAVVGVNAADALVILTDGRTDLAVRHAGTGDADVWLVADDDGWTGIAPVASLADLGAALATQQATQQATTPGGRP